jgi:hypothetical protein
MNNDELKKYYMRLMAVAFLEIGLAVTIFYIMLKNMN